MSKETRRFASVDEIIQSRRTIFKFKPGPIGRETLQEILKAGTWAPNHHLTEPWRFTVIGEATKLILAGRYREIQKEKAAQGTSEEHLHIIGQKGHDKFMGKPTIVAVSCVQEGDEQAQREDYAAACSAMTLIQLAGWERGVGMQWSTGPITREQATYDLLGIDSSKEYILGFYYMGYPAEVPPAKRKPLHDVLRWTD